MMPREEVGATASELDIFLEWSHIGNAVAWCSKGLRIESPDYTLDLHVQVVLNGYCPVMGGGNGQ